MKTIFISYSHKDEIWKDRFKPHVTMLEKAGLQIKIWDDRRIDVGDNWYPEITQAIEQATVAVCLISADYLASDFCMKEEVPFLMKKREQEGMLLIPVLIRPCLWQLSPWLKKLQMLPRNGKAVAQHFPDDYDDVFMIVASTIYDQLQDPTLAPKVLPPKWKPPEKCDLTRMPITGGELFGRTKELELLDTAWESSQTRVISFVAWGAAGKSTLINKWLESMQADNFKGARRVYSWSFYNQGSDKRIISTDQFIHNALKWFGDSDPKQGSPWDKGIRLAALIQNHPTLLILDGLKPMQSGHNFEKGQIKDPSLAVMLKGLMRCTEKDAAQSLCVITTRVELSVAERYQASFQQIDLEQISKAAGRALLRVQGIRGSDAQLEQASEMFGNHSLALNLLGAYLRDMPGHHIDHIKDIPEIDVTVAKGRHARKIMNAFALRWGDSSETELLHILGLFEHPADQAAIDAIIGQTIISGLTDHLQNQSKEDWLLMIEKLRKARLIASIGEHHPDSLDCHPLVRKHFGENLHQTNAQAWQQAHERLYEYYKNLPEQQLPDTLEDMAPLFSAVAHGCMAGKHQEVLDDVYWERIRRKNDHYVGRLLGAFSSDLAALSSFFEIPWHQPAAGLTDDYKAVVQSWAGFSLRALGRLQEASAPIKAGLDALIQQENWGQASGSAGNLSELFLTLGKVNAAVDYARQSVAFADKSGDDFLRESMRTALADALHQSGEFTEADRLFREAEVMQKERRPECSFLYSVQGFRFCDLLLSQGRYGEVIERAEHGLVIAKEYKTLLHIALDTLSLGRAHLLQALEQISSNFKPAETYLNDAVEGLRKAGVQNYIPRGLLSRAALYRAQKNFTRAWEDLDETLEIAEQADMKLFLVDFHIEVSHVLCAEMDSGSATNEHLIRLNSHINKVFELLKITGYYRKINEIDNIKNFYKRMNQNDKNADLLESNLRKNIIEYSYSKASDCFDKIVNEYPERKTRLKEELGFLLELETEKLDEDSIEEDKIRVMWRQQIWQILSERNDFKFKLKKHDVQSALIHTEEETEQDKDQYKEAISNTLASEDKRIIPQQRGEILENAIVDLFRKFFTIGENNKQMLLSSIRKQKSGTQYGHDINFTFKDTVTLKDNHKIKCHVECKNFSKKQISANDIVHKIAVEHRNYVDLDYWILISPHSVMSNELNDMVQFWESNQSYPFQIQIWSKDNDVEEFFCLQPIIHNRIYVERPRKYEPQTFDQNKLDSIYEKWRKKLPPLMRLPKCWENYIREPRKLLFQSENFSELDSLFKKHVPLRFTDVAGNLKSSSLETYIINWLNSNNDPVKLLLGEFGDGKTVFTYIIARKLTQQFLKEPADGWIPVRFSLQGFNSARNIKEFIEDRINFFGADIDSWDSIRHNHKILVILDGFDEMSYKFDPLSIAQNIKKIEQFCNELSYTKILITSRIHFFQNSYELQLLKERIKNPEILQLASTPRKIVLNYLKEAAEKFERLKLLQTIKDFHDPIGLSSKPLFMELIKDLITSSANLDRFQSNLTIIDLYESFIDNALERKNVFLENEEDFLQSKKQIRDNLICLLEEIALEIHFSEEKCISLSKFDNKKRYGSLAEKLWRSIDIDENSEEDETMKFDENTEKDVTKRIEVRSLLKKIRQNNEESVWPVDFCHRSLREFFVAKMLHRIIVEDKERLKTFFNQNQLNYEIIYFASEIMLQDSDNIQNIKNTLYKLIRETASDKQTMFLATNLTNLLFKIDYGLPNEDWSNLQLDQVDLEGADLSSKNFFGSSLRRANLDNVNFENANFQNANLTGVRFDETKKVKSIALHPSEKKILAAYKDGKIREWDISIPGTNKHEVVYSNSLDNNISWVGYSPSEDICAIINEKMIFFDRVVFGQLSIRAKFPINPDYRFVFPEKNHMVLILEDIHLKKELRYIDLKSKKIISNMNLQEASIFKYIKQNTVVYIQEEKNFRIEGPEIEGLISKYSHDIKLDNEVTCLSFTTLEDEETFLVACGTVNGHIIIIELKFLVSEGWSHNEITNCKAHSGIVTDIIFCDANRIISGGMDGKIVFNEFEEIKNSNEKKFERPPLQLSIKCKGMKIDGVQSTKERKKLEKLISLQKRINTSN